MNEQLRASGASTLPSANRSSRAASRSVAFGIVSLVFGLPGAVLLTALLALGSDLASAWAWVFGGFWTLAVAAGRALDLAGADLPG